MPTAYPSSVFEIRGESGRVIGFAKSLEATTLYGIEGFCLHSKPGPVWCVSHRDTGSLVGEGRTKEEAVEDALVKAGSRDGLIDGMRKMRRLVEAVDGKLVYVNR